MSGVIDGQSVNAAITDAAFLHKNADETMTYALALTDTTSASINSIQDTTNIIINAVGGNQSTPATAYGSLPSSTFSATDTHDVALGKLARKFYALSASGGHTHDGTDGNGPLVTASGLGNVSLEPIWITLGAVFASAASTLDVSAVFVSSIPSRASSAQGVIVNTPYNLASLSWGSGTKAGVAITDPNGREVFGRITESSGTWTMNTYVNGASGATGYAIPGSDIIVVAANQLINPINNVYQYEPLRKFYYLNVNSIQLSGAASAMSGDITVAQGSGISIVQSGHTLTFSASGASVSSIAASGQSALTGAVTLSASGGTTLTESGQNIQVFSPLAVTLAASGSSALTGNITLSASGGVVLTQSGQNIQVYAPTGSGGGGGGALNSCIFVGGSTTCSSSFNRIPVFNTVSASAGTDLTFSNSAASGSAITVNTTGTYSIRYSGVGGNQNMGITVNEVLGTTGNTAITSVTWAQGNRAIINSPNITSQVSTTIPLTAGDVVRPHSDGNNQTSDVILNQFSVTRVN